MTEEEKDEHMAATWEQLIEEGKMGYMALLRNLRNLLDRNVSKSVLDKAMGQLTNPKAVARSRQFPFRFLAAYNEVEGHASPQAAIIMEALEEAVKLAAANVPGFSRDTSLLIANDVSGSMSGTISPRSTIRTSEVGLMLGLMLREHCKAVTTCIFADNCEVVNIPQGNILGGSKVIQSHNIGGGTNGWKVLEKMNNLKQQFDKVMVFTDCEMWDNEGNGGGHEFRTEWHKYKKKYPASKLYLFNVQGYGTTPLSIHEKDVYYIAGWSEKVFDVMEAIDNGSSAVAEIRKIEV
jgi:hypothetical protein